MDIESLIAPQSFRYEEVLLKDPDNESVWLDYLELLQGDFRRSQFVLHRAVTQLPGSTLLWNAYLLLPWKDSDHKKLLSLIEVALLVLNPTPSLYLRYVTLAMDTSSTQFIISAFNKALMSLEIKYHGILWKKFLTFADSIKGKEGALIYSRFFAVCGQFEDGPKIKPDQCLLQIANFGEIVIAKRIFLFIQEHKLQLSQPLSSVVMDYCDILTSIPSFRDFSYFEALISAASVRFPEMKSELYLKGALYLALRESYQKAHRYFQLGLSSSMTIKQMTTVFDKYANFQEREISQLIAFEDEDMITLRMDIYEKFLNEQARYVNDVQLRQNTNNVDFWLDRAKIFENRNDESGILQTLVKAIITINPLAALSNSGKTLADLWIHYSDIYISQGDFETSNIIFSKAVKSQFKSLDELADIHIAWTEALLQSTNDEVAVSHLENILLTFEGNGENTEEPAQANLVKCHKLWIFYMDLLKSIYEDELRDAVLQKWSKAFEAMSSIKIISIKFLLDSANFLQKHGLWARSLSIYEKGLKAFVSPEARYEIYKEYISRLLTRDDSSIEDVRELFDHCIAQRCLPGYLAKSIYLKYIEFERRIGSTMKTIKITHQAINYLTYSYDSNISRYSKSQLNKIADDKFELYQLLLKSIENIGDNDWKREAYSESVQDKHLTLPQIMQLGLAFISFEITCKELSRARALFKHLVRLKNPNSSVVAQVWSQWQKFELGHGTEETYKDMLRFKRKAIHESNVLETEKREANPMGFVKSETISAVKENPKISDESNPDIIELDIDM